ncbi:hypothetical protein LJC33_03950 [Eubacteriales bacterium OttesenSCG-928-N13]|nr:hypothetical protein [Eubacteriales bacterium OttesenSCG-928-N13]
MQQLREYLFRAYLLNIHHYARFEFNRETFFKNRHLLNQPPNQPFIVLRDGRGLLPEECAHIVNALELIVAIGAFNQEPLLFIAQAVNLFTDRFVISFRTGKLHEPDLQILQAFVNIGECLIVFLKERGFNISPLLPKSLK